MNIGRPRGWWARWHSSIIAVIAAAAIVWSMSYSIRTAHRANTLSAQVADVVNAQQSTVCTIANTNRALVADALERIVDDVALVSNDPSTERVLDDLRSYIEKKLAPVDCPVQAHIDGAP